MKDSSKTVFTAFVKYEQPSFEELVSRFPAVSEHLMRAKFVAMDANESISTQNREVRFMYVHLGRPATYGAALREMWRLKVRAARYEEFLCFVEKFSEKHGKYPIIAGGSELLQLDDLDESQHVVSLSDGKNGPKEIQLTTLRYRHHEGGIELPANTRFLAVCE